MPAPKSSSEEAKRILSPLSENHAFYFYNDIGVPTGLSARSLSEFLDVLRSVEDRSIEFHVGRGDFENWVRMFGDETLAKQLAGLKDKSLSGAKLRRRVLQVVRLRRGLLAKIAYT